MIPMEWSHPPSFSTGTTRKILSWVQERRGKEACVGSKAGLILTSEWMEETFPETKHDITKRLSKRHATYLEREEAQNSELLCKTQDQD